MAYKSKKRARDDGDDDSDMEVDTKPTKTTKKVKTGGADLDSGKDDQGNSWWGLSHTRRVGLSEFKKKPYVNIREYYEAAGVMKPGKKGISLTVEQYNALLKAIPAINAELSAQGHDVAEIPSGPALSSGVQKSTTKEKKKPTKANIEATSDEEDEDDED